MSVFKASNTSLKISRREILNFHISGSIRRKKVLETGNVPLLSSYLNEIHFDA